MTDEYTHHYRAAYEYAATMHHQAPTACRHFADFYMSGRGMDRRWTPGDPLDAIWRIWVMPC